MSREIHLWNVEHRTNIIYYTNNNHFLALFILSYEQQLLYTFAWFLCKYSNIRGGMVEWETNVNAITQIVTADIHVEVFYEYFHLNRTFLLHFAAVYD